jgi:hypothetical protein
VQPEPVESDFLRFEMVSRKKSQELRSFSFAPPGSFLFIKTLEEVANASVHKKD